MTHGFIIAGTNSGSGKTTITSGLMRLLSRQSLQVAPFKTGPDFIDPAFHTVATGVQSHNLDTFMLSHDTVRALFSTKASRADVAIAEGVMGLFDGMGNEGHGSTAELARILQLPVILVVNCSALYQSVAAIVNGFASFDSSIRIAGVILNHVYTETQYQFLKQYIESHGKVRCIGYLPPNQEISLDSRHLGLIQAHEIDQLSHKTDRIADLLDAHLDINLLLDLTRTNCKVAEYPSSPHKGLLKGLKLGVALDKAFAFYYQSNLDLMRQEGAELHFFSPLNDMQIPDGLDAMYLGGGYPEVFAQTLSENHSMLESIRNAATNGMPIYGECGGLMYLTEGIKDTQGNFYPMCGIYNCKSEMTVRLQNFGYCEVDWDQTRTIAHEFHHSHLAEPDEANYEKVFQVARTDKSKKWTGGLMRHNVLAGYPHVHFLSNTAFFEKLCSHWKA